MCPICVQCERIVQSIELTKWCHGFLAVLSLVLGPQKIKYKLGSTLSRPQTIGFSQNLDPVNRDYKVNDLKGQNIISRHCLWAFNVKRVVGERYDYLLQVYY